MLLSSLALRPLHLANGMCKLARNSIASLVTKLSYHARAYSITYSNTFLHRWRNSLPSRKWPFRKHSKLENSIKSLKAWQKRGHDVTDNLEQLYKERQTNVTPAKMYYYEKDVVVGVVRDESSIGNPPPSVLASSPHHHPLGKNADRRSKKRSTPDI